jgi:hypothetical protein
MKFSEAIRHINIDKFSRNGDLEKDAERYLLQTHWDIRLLEYIKLRLAFGKTITLHTLTDGVVNKIRNTRICNMPHEIPHFLTEPFMIEARHDNVLFDDVVCVAGYLSEGELCLITTFQDHNSVIQYIDGAYDGRGLESIIFTEFGITGGKERNVSDANSISFATIFALMIEAERTPIVIESVRVKGQGVGSKIKPNDYTSEWIEKRVFIDKRYVPQYKSNTHGELDTEGKVLKDVYVHGFLRYQAYGPELKLRKWIYIEGFDSTRWAKPGHTKIIVDVYNK